MCGWRETLGWKFGPSFRSSRLKFAPNMDRAENPRPKVCVDPNRPPLNRASILSSVPLPDSSYGSWNITIHGAFSCWADRPPDGVSARPKPENSGLGAATQNAIGLFLLRAPQLSAAHHFRRSLGGRTTTSARGSAQWRGSCTGSLLPREPRATSWPAVSAFHGGDGSFVILPAAATLVFDASRQTPSRVAAVRLYGCTISHLVKA